MENMKNTSSLKLQLKTWKLLKASEFYIRGRKQCLICGNYIHKRMENCQPCELAQPRYSQLHKYVLGALLVGNYFSNYIGGDKT